MNSVRSAICEQLEADFDGRLLNLLRKQNDITGPLGGISSGLGGMTPSNPFDLGNAVNSAASDANGMIPDMSTPAGKNAVLNEIAAMVGECLYMKQDPTMSNPDAMLGILTKKFLEMMSGNTFGSISTIDFPELNFALGLSRIADMFKDLSFATEIPKMDLLLNCLSEICGRDVQSRIDSMNTATDSMYCGADGSFDDSQFYADAGISQSAIDNVKSSTDTINTTKQDAEDVFNTASGMIA